MSPPASDGRDGELGCAGAGADNHQGLVVPFIEDAIGNGLALGIAGKVVDVDLVGLSAIARTGTLEIADQFSLLGVYADHGLIVPDEQRFDPLDVTILLVRLRVRLADQALDIGLERVPCWFEEFGHGTG